MSELNKLYKHHVLEHNRNPRNYGKPAEWTHYSEGLNAICGDQVHIYMTLEDGFIKAIHFAGDSCAISMASASMMTELLTGKSTQQALQLFTSFKQMMAPEGLADAESILGSAASLAGVKKFPSRIKSATLCWYAMQAAIKGQTTATTE